jgi:hypothetical protein
MPLCECGLPCRTGTSHSAKNPGRTYLSCAQQHNCKGFLCWDDDKRFDTVDTPVTCDGLRFKVLQPVFQRPVALRSLVCECGRPLFVSWGKPKCQKDCAQNWRQCMMPVESLQRIAAAELGRTVSVDDLKTPKFAEQCARAVAERKIVF